MTLVKNSTSLDFVVVYFGGKGKSEKSATLFLSFVAWWAEIVTGSTRIGTLWADQFLALIAFVITGHRWMVCACQKTDLRGSALCIHE